MYKIRMKVGKNTYPITDKLLKHNEAEVIEVDDAGEFVRLVDKTEWEGKDLTAKPKAKQTKSKSPKKKKAAKKSAVSNDNSLENIDVSSI